MWNELKMKRLEYLKIREKMISEPKLKSNPGKSILDHRVSVNFDSYT